MLPEQEEEQVGRGKYKRQKGCALRSGWEAAAQEHMQRISSSDMLHGSLSCVKGCSFGGQCMQAVFT
eukprot:5418785-Pleurochrysis_carterae.AAC.1